LLTGQIATVFHSYHAFAAPPIINFALFVIFEFALLGMENS